MTLVLDDFWKRCRRRLKRARSAILGEYRCPVCKREVPQYDPMDTTYYSDMTARYGERLGWAPLRMETLNREQYRCPRCRIHDRGRLMALYLRQRLPELGSGGTLHVLDIAPTGALSAMLRRLLTSMPGDVVYRTADLSKEGVDDHVDICDMPIYPDNSWDLLLCSHVLEHVDDDRRAMRELYRILKPHGEGLLLVPINLNQIEVDEDPTITDPGERYRRFGQHDHVRRYSRQGFVERLRECGFSVSQLGVDYFGPQAFRQAGIAPTSVLYVVRKDPQAEQTDGVGDVSVLNARILPGTTSSDNHTGHRAED